VEAGVYVPVCIVLARPFIEHLMLSAVATVSGRDTGSTLFGPADMQLSANTSVKTIEGHYTCHTKAVITKPQNVYVMRDIMCSGYVAGGNCMFFGLEPGKTVFDGSADPKKIKEQINSRLAFDDDEANQGRFPSLLAFLTTPDEANNPWRDQVISVSNRVLPWEIKPSGEMSGSHQYFPGGQRNYDAYAEALGLKEIHAGMDVNAMRTNAYLSQGTMNNSVCFLGPHRRYNPLAQNFYEHIPGQGHFGPDAVPGDARWRRGESVSLESARSAMVSLELATHSTLAFGHKNSAI